MNWLQVQVFIVKQLTNTEVMGIGMVSLKNWLKKIKCSVQCVRGFIELILDAIDVKITIVVFSALEFLWSSFCDFVTESFCKI